MVQSPDEKNEINFPIIFKKHAHIFPTLLKSARRLNPYLLLLFLLFFSQPT